MADVLAQLGAERRRSRARRAARARPRRRRRPAPRPTGREHAGGDLPGARIAGVEHDRAQPATGRAPRAGQADRPAARYGEVIRAGGHCWTFPPYAGTTRIRFDGRRPIAALSARWSRAPVVALHGSPDDPPRAPRDRPPVPRVRRPAARMAGGGGARRRRSRAAARQDARRRRAGRRRARVPRSSARCSSSTTGPTSWTACDADGVHVGQDDATPAEARAVVGPERIVGRSTHAPGAGRRGGRRPGRRLPRRRAGARDADQARAPRRRSRVRRARGAHRDASRGSRSAASTPATCARWSSAARAGSSSCAPSPRPTTPSARHGSSREDCV